MDPEFQIIEGDEAQRIRQMPSRTALGALAKAVMAGHVVRLANTRQGGIAGRLKSVRQRGYRVMTRSDGNGGVYVWAIKP